MSSQAILSMDGITRWYRGEKLVFNRIDLKVYEHEKVCIRGNGGSGKSTLFRLMTGQELPDEGTVERTQAMAVMLEQLPGMEAMNVREYVMLPLQLQGKSCLDDCHEAVELVKHCGLWEKRYMKTHFLNAYEKCCLQLAMALVLKPRLMVMEHCLKHLTAVEANHFWALAEELLAPLNPAVICFSDQEVLAFPFTKRYDIVEGTLMGVNMS